MRPCTSGRGSGRFTSADGYPSVPKLSRPQQCAADLLMLVSLVLGLLRLVLSRSRMPAQPTPEGELHTLLCRFFRDSAELHRFLVLQVDQNLTSMLPADTVPLSDFAHECVQLLRRRGINQSSLFAALTGAFDKRKTEIASVASRFRFDVDDPLTRSSESQATVRHASPKKPASGSSWRSLVLLGAAAMAAFAAFGALWCQRAHEGEPARIVDGGTGQLRAQPAPEEQLFSLCEIGNSDACRMLGALYVDDPGQGAVRHEVNFRRLAEALDRGCNLGAVDGCTVLGLMFGDGIGVNPDPSRGVKLLDRGCELGSALACSGLAIAYSSGIGVAKDDVHAVHLAKNGCDGGAVRGCSLLAEHYFHGHGVEQSDVVAATYARRACQGNDALGCEYIGTLYMDGYGVAHDDHQAVGYFQQACDLNNAMGCIYLGTMYSHARGVARDRQQARSLYSRACDAGETFGCNHLGVQLLEGNDADKRNAFNLFDGLCKKGGKASGFACLNLATMYLRGDAVVEDAARAVEILEQSCATFSGSCGTLGVLYALGRGVKQDIERAKTYLEMACSGGFAEECEHIGRMYEGNGDHTVDLTMAATYYKKSCDSAALAPREYSIAPRTAYYVELDTFVRVGVWGRGAYGCFLLGKAYALGRGVLRSEARAQTLFQRACARGYSDACLAAIQETDSPEGD